MHILMANLTRVKGTVTIGLHVYHPLLRSIVQLASMDSDAEDMEAVQMFFTYRQPG